MVQLRLVRLILPACVLLLAALTRGQDLPLPQQGPLPAGPEAPVADPTRLLKPTKSIKPPLPQALVVTPSRGSTEQLLTAEQKLLGDKLAALAGQRAREAGATAALKRLVLVQGPLPPKQDRSVLPPATAKGQSLTLVGINAPKEMVQGLEQFFGAALTPDNEKKLLETVRKGLAGTAEQGRKVEVLGWWPQEGVMAVSVSPDEG